MPIGDQLAGQWKIIQTLITPRRGKSAAELAEELEFHPRTLHRDLEALQVAGTEEIKFWFMSWGSKAEVNRKHGGKRSGWKQRQRLTNTANLSRRRQNRFRHR